MNILNCSTLNFHTSECLDAKYSLYIWKKNFCSFAWIITMTYQESSWTKLLISSTSTSEFWHFHKLLHISHDSRKPVRWFTSKVTRVKDRRWVSNWITLEFEWTVHNSEWWVVWKYHLFTFVFLHFFNLWTNVTIFVLHFWKIYSLTLLLMWLKDLFLHKGYVKTDEYYGMFWALYSSNDRSSCYAWGLIYH